MKLVTFDGGQGPRAGALVADEIVELTAAGAAISVLELIRSGADGLTMAAAAVTRGGQRVALAGVRLLPPIPNPGKVLCCGINYKSHADENPKAVMPTEPFFFAKMPSSVAGPEDQIRVPPMSKQRPVLLKYPSLAQRT